ncbi:hypothetical protein [Pseudoprevotella muciniphila]|uniref:hypothetical protein n=1 Tax=Pseudoprevotella muciniphila TaxID=2133944 RepID=UPI0011BD0D8A|nr:hypothetical protein [Pseudoprevotella muciniphila]
MLRHRRSTYSSAQIALEETKNIIADFFPLAPSFLPDVARSVRQHHDKRLVIHTVQNILTAPACRIRNLPDKTEGAMAAFILGS